MKNVLTKRKVLVLASIGAIALLLLAFVVQGGDYCYNTEWCNNLWDKINLVGLLLFPFPFLLLFSLITYFLPEKVFRSWIHFAVWWIPLSMLLTSLTPNGGGGWSIPNVLDQEMVAFLTSALFIIISLIIIIVSFMRGRTKKRATT